MALQDPSVIPRGPLTVPLNYYRPPSDDSDIPYNNVDHDKTGLPQRNYSNDTQPTLVTDARGNEANFALDRDAFQILQQVAPSAEKDFEDDDSIKDKYYPEVEKLLLDHVPGSNKVYIFDHTIRKAKPGANRAPVQMVHIDQVAASVQQRVRHYYPAEEAEALLSQRYRIINVWRTLNKNPVESHPLAYASSASVEDDDVVPIEHRYPSGYKGQTAAVKYNAGQKWYYLSGMTPDERILLECFDSASLKEGSTIKGRVPHSAFVDPRTRADAEERESIEVRALVFGS